MPKKIYHIPNKKVIILLKKHHSKLQSLLLNTKRCEYHKRISKAHYLCSVESFLHTFGIDKDIDYALKLMTYFESKRFYEILYGLMGGGMGENINLETLLRLQIIRKIDVSLYETFLRMAFVHYSSEHTSPSNVHIDYKAIAIHLAKQLNIKLKESFGTEDNHAFFNIYHKEELLAGANGKSIKTLRKKVYKELVEVLSQRKD